jgi:subtilisin family serine protease
MRPKAIYIMLPVEPGDQMDTSNAAAGAVFPDGDQTEPDDGWAAFSGTSAAAPQLAGILALMKQVAPSLSPLAMRAILAATARDVAAGMCSPVSDLHRGLPAVPGPDDATGPGLVDAFAAVVTAYIASLTVPLSGVARHAAQSGALATYCYWTADAMEGAGLPAAYSEPWRGAGHGYAALAAIN